MNKALVKKLRMEVNVISGIGKKPDYIGVKSNGIVKWLISTQCNGILPLREWTPYSLTKKIFWRLYLWIIPIQRALANLGIQKGYSLVVGGEPAIEGVSVACVYVNLVTFRPKLVLFLVDGSGNYLVNKFPLNDAAQRSLENEKILMETRFPEEVIKVNSNLDGFYYCFDKQLGRKRPSCLFTI